MSDSFSTDDPLIEAKNIAVSLGGDTVLDGVSLAVEPGELVGLVGPNGAGKTTLLRVLNGTLTPDAGTVEVEGDSLTGLGSREVARRVATVPQETRLSFEFSVEDVVEMGRTPYISRFGRTTPDDRTAVAAAMERAAVAEFADRSVTSLSGGERQRVLLAQALAQQTPVLLLDEPTANLDINHQVETFEVIRAAVDGDGDSSENSSVDGDRAGLAAIHDLDLAARYCDRLLLLADGSVQASGDPAAVLGDDALAAAFGVPTRLSEDPATGTPRVTALDRDRAAGDRTDGKNTAGDRTDGDRTVGDRTADES